MECRYRYQGEANTDEGYHRNREQYKCQFESLINGWRAALGYKLPFVWVLLHPWGGLWDGPAAELSAQTLVRLAQADVAAAGLGATGMVANMDGCQADGGIGPTCNLHPGYKSAIAARLAKQLVGAAYGGAQPALPAPQKVAAAVAADGQSATVTVDVAAADGLKLTSIHDCGRAAAEPRTLPSSPRCQSATPEHTRRSPADKKIYHGKGCADTLNSGLVTAPVTTSDADCNLLGTVKVAARQLVASFALKGQQCGDDTNITKVQSLWFMPEPIATCVVQNGDGEVMAPFVHDF